MWRISTSPLVVFGLCLSFFCIELNLVQAVPASKRASPAIVLDDGTFTGTTTGTVDKFLGIPFAQPPLVILSFHPVT